ncbi:hypothetical protein M9458_025894, partial [Cirrhinus mrigala]
VPDPHSLGGWALHGNIRTSVDTTTSPSPALMHRVPCQSRPTEQGKRSEEPCFLLDRPCSTSPQAYCQGYPGYCLHGVVVASHSVTMAGQDDSAQLCDSVRQASVQVHTTVLRQEIANFFAKDAIKPVPPAKMKKGFYSSYFIVPKKRRWSETNPRSLS